MSIAAIRKQQLIQEFATKPGDTGSPEVQVATALQTLTRLLDAAGLRAAFGVRWLQHRFSDGQNHPESARWTLPGFCISRRTLLVSRLAEAPAAIGKLFDGSAWHPHKPD